MKIATSILTALLALSLAGCGMFGDKKPDPNFQLQLEAYKQAVTAKQAVETARADKPVQVLTIKGQGDKPIIMSGISEITVSLPQELFQKGGSASAQVSMPSLPVEQPGFLERTADKLVGGFIASIPVLGQTYVQVTGQKEATKQALGQDQMWTSIFANYKPTTTTTTTTNTSRSGNSGGNVGDSSGNTSGNSGVDSGDNRGNTDQSGDNRNNVPTPGTPTCTATPTTPCP